MFVFTLAFYNRTVKMKSYTITSTIDVADVLDDLDDVNLHYQLYVYI